MFLRQSVFGFLFLLAVAASGFSQEPEEQKSPATNLEIMRSLAQRIVIRTLNDANIGEAAKIRVTVLPKESAWYIESGLAEGIKSANLSLSNDGTAPIALEFGLNAGRVAYSNLRRSGFLGRKLVDRKITLQLTSKVLHLQTGKINLTSEIEESSLDTIDLSDVSSVENPAIPMTKGRLPSEGFFSNFAEPLILIGSIGVAVVLLFNVRS